MNRSITNAIRFVMDEMVPPLIRDSKIFMYPFYLFAYRGKNIKQVMQFKSLVYNFTEEEYANFYKGLNTISRNRPTDLNKACVDFILQHIDPSSETVLDVGCGSGYMLNKIHEKNSTLSLTGFDIKEPQGDKSFKFVEGNVEKLPFEDDSFDVVLCNHTIEHLLELETCISELLRVTKKQLFVVTPCQRYYYYTLDEHVNFFPFQESLTHHFQGQEFICNKLQGDWALLITK